MVDACKFGMNNYERKNFKVAADKETITCNEKKNYGSIGIRYKNYDNELAKQDVEEATETFTN